MKIEVTPETQPSPPKVVILTMTEEEARRLAEVADRGEGSARRRRDYSQGAAEVYVLDFGEGLLSDLLNKTLDAAR
jgi:hypothetical protein